MQRRSKILIIALVACLAGGATYFFRKRGPSLTDEMSPPAQAESERRGAEKPAPQSHLLGEIQTADQPPGDADLAPVAPAGGTTSAAAVNPFSSSSGVAGGAPPASSSASPADNSFFPPTGAAGPAGASAFSSPGGASEVLRHKIVDGDTLTALAERYLGSANRYQELFEMNRDTLASPDLLPIGAELKVPARGLLSSPPTSDAPQPMVPLQPAG